MDLNKLAEALVPDENVKPLEYYEKLYPERDLPKGAEVTRLAPSPTGFMHLGNLYVAIANERVAHQSGGVFYLRIEEHGRKAQSRGRGGGHSFLFEIFWNHFRRGRGSYGRLRSLLSASESGDLSRLREGSHSSRTRLSLLLYGRGTRKDAGTSDGK